MIHNDGHESSEITCGASSALAVGDPPRSYGLRDRLPRFPVMVVPAVLLIAWGVALRRRHRPGPELRAGRDTAS
jgi:hypothetical protein